MEKNFFEKLKTVLSAEEILTISVALNLLSKQTQESGLGSHWIELAKKLTNKE